MAAIGVVRRVDELATIEAFLAALDRGPRALVLAGDAGIGKTVLWKDGVDAAEWTGGFWDATGSTFYVSVQHNMTGQGTLLAFTGFDNAH